MPIPIMPKRTWSLAATVCGKAQSGSGSRKIVFSPKDAPATAALSPMNSRREKPFLFIKPPPTSRRFNRRTRTELFLQHLERNFFEKYDVILTVILEADVAFLRTRPTFRLKREFLGWHRIALGELRHFHPVQHDGRVRAIQRDFHGVPLRPGFTRMGQRLGHRIQRSSDVIVIL